MKKKKVLIVHNYYKIPGGEDSVVENEKNLLLENGHDVKLYTRNNNEINSKGIIGKVLLPFETIFSIKTYKDTRKIIEKNNIDIVHVHNTFPLISPSIYYAAKKSNAKIIQTLHNFRFLCPNALFVKNNQVCELCRENGLFHAIKNKCYRKSFFQSLLSVCNIKIHRMIGTFNIIDNYIALTEFSKKKFDGIIDLKKISVKPNFIKRENNNISKISEYFVYVGRMDKLKGIDMLLNAWNEIENEKLFLIGTGPEDDNIIEFINDKKLKNVKFLGYKKKEEVINIIANAKSLIIPSQCYENFPMTIVESFSLGVPCIGGNIGNLAQIIRDKENGILFEYNNYKDLVRAVKDISCDNELYKKVCSGAREDYLKMYNEKVNYNELIKIYNK